MVYGMLSRLGRVRFTVSYVAALAAVSSAIVMIGPQAQERVIARASTNLHNLSHGHVGTLLGSAFVVDAGPIYFWMPFLTILLALAELQLHTVRLIIAFLVGHIGATLVVAAVLASAVELEWMPHSIARASDVGMSYGALAVVGALTAAIPGRWRPAWIAWWATVSVTAGFVCGQFTNVGHAIALMLGVLISARLSPPVHWTPLRLLMLVNASGFGFLLLVHHWGHMATAASLGVLGALTGHLLAQYVTGRGNAAGGSPDDTLRPALTN
jgi:hypothetical protein